MNLLTITDTDRHRFEWPTLQEKKQKKLPPHEKILMPTHIAHICLCPSTHRAIAGAKSKECNRQRFTKYINLNPIFETKIFL